MKNNTTMKKIAEIMTDNQLETLAVLVAKEEELELSELSTQREVFLEVLEIVDEDIFFAKMLEILSDDDLGELAVRISKEEELELSEISTQKETFLEVLSVLKDHASHNFENKGDCKMTTFNLGVSWTVWGTVAIEAPTLVEAVEKFEVLNREGKICLPENSEYVEDSFKLDAEGENAEEKAQYIEGFCS